MTGQIIYLNNIDMNMFDVELMNMSKAELIRIINSGCTYFTKARARKKSNVKRLT